MDLMDGMDVLIAESGFRIAEYLTMDCREELNFLGWFVGTPEFLALDSRQYRVRLGGAHEE
jgi:hypothetical protein